MAIFIHRDEVEPDPSIPRFFDLGRYDQNNSIPYTHSFNLVAALHSALKNLDVNRGLYLCKEVKRILTRRGIEFLGDDSYTPGIIPIPLHKDASSKEFGDNLKSKNIIVSYESDLTIENKLGAGGIDGRISKK
ncbi:hypothetical protein V1502_08475 [Bacillus sp. SCS-153A]|uniref:hypothetical protein n=1 Tax=Rossellomorea sedimentorum TaxID=3115294 RepID=UPI003906C1B7